MSQGQVEVPMEEVTPKEKKTKKDERKQKVKQLTEVELNRLKEVIHLIDENKVSAWLEEDARVSSKDGETLNQFFPKSGVHSRWKEIATGDLQSVTSWIETTKGREEDINIPDEANKLNALHYAILFKNVEIMKALLECNNSPKWSRMLPTQQQLASFRESIDLLKAPPSGYMDIGKLIGALFWGNTFNSAVEENRLEDAKLLMKHGANPMHCWKGTTMLEKAIKKRNKPIVQAMMLSMLMKEGARERAWKIDTERLKDVTSCTSTDKVHQHTPFTDLITNLPDVAKLVLDHCISDSEPHDEDYEISFDCSLFENENSNVNKCLRGLPCTCCCNIAREMCQGDEIYSDQFCNFDDEEAVYDAYEKHHHPLYKVMQSNDPGLLKHPVVLALLDWKLNRYGWLLYYSNLLAYVILVSLLTAFILILPNPQDPKCLELKLNEADNNTLTESENISSHSIITMLAFELDANIPTLTSLQTFTLILAIFRLILELYQLYSRKVVGYFNDWVNWFELAEYISILIFLFSVRSGECFCSENWEWEVGVVSVALSWVVLVAWLQAMHWMGIYVTILIRIIVSFARVAIFGLLLVIGFGLTFYLLFFQPPQDETVNAPSVFSNPLRAILSVIALTAGDIDMGGVFYSDSPDSPSPGRQYESLAFIIWLAGLIIMSVLFNNLLVGLAVGEVSNVIEEARNTTIKQRIELVLTQEEQFPDFIHKRIIRKKPILIHPYQLNLFYSILLFIAVAGCCICSFMFYNNNHVRYWFHLGDSLFGDTKTQPKINKKYKEVPGLIEKARLNAEEIERGEENPVTKIDMDNLGEQMAAMQAMLLEIKRGM